MFLKRFNGTEEWTGVQEESVRESLSREYESTVDEIIDRMKCMKLVVFTDYASFRYISEIEVENAGERTVFAELTLDELTWLRRTGGDTGPLDYVMAKAVGKAGNGIRIESAILTDDDSDNEWERYIASLIRWAMDNIDEDCKGKKPPTFESEDGIEAEEITGTLGRLLDEEEGVHLPEDIRKEAYDLYERAAKIVCGVK